MKIAVSGTHCIGKTSFIEDFIKQYPSYKFEVEPYHQLEDELTSEFALEPSLENLEQQLICSIELLHQCKNDENIIFDRCPVDFIAYAMCSLEEDSIHINDSGLSERFDEIKEALDCLDIILFFPINPQNSIEYYDENPEYRELADENFKRLYREEICDLFPRYNHPRIIEISGDRKQRIEIVDSYIT